MGFNIRKRIKIAPGLHLNLGKNGVSVSAGIKGATVNLGKDGTRTTLGIPGSGMSYTNRDSYAKSDNAPTGSDIDRFKLDNSSHSASVPTQRKVSLLLGIGIFLMPYIFAWLLLRDGYSKTARILSFVWMGVVLLRLIK